MNIHTISNLSIPSLKQTNNKQIKRHFSLEADTFEKSTTKQIQNKNVSFKGYNLFGSGMLGLFGDFYSNLKVMEEERVIAKLIEDINTKQIKSILNSRKNQSIRDLLSIGVSDSKIRGDKNLKLFEEANIRTGIQLAKFLNTYSKCNSEFAGQAIEAIKIYGKLNVKDDLANYPEILLHIYNSESSQKNPNYEKLNEYTKFLKDIGVNRTKDFENKYAYLKPLFNDFETPLDKTNAISHIKATYPKKLEFLSSIIKGHPELGKDANKIYTLDPAIVDHFFNKNNGESLNGIENVLDISIQNKKLKSKSLELVQDAFGDIEQTENRIRFYKFLHDSNVNAVEFSTIVKNTPIKRETEDFLQAIENKEYLSLSIAEMKGISIDEASKIYANFNDVINSIYDEETDDTSAINTLLKIIDTYKLKDNTSLANLYSKATGLKPQSISKQEVKEFIELFKYSDEQNILEEAKKQKKLPIDLLKKNKEIVLKENKEITNIIEEDSTGTLDGETVESIRTKYAKEIKQNKNGIQGVVKELIQQTIKNQEQIKAKEIAVKAFTDFFESKTDFNTFITNNKISFDDTKTEQEYRNNCLLFLSAIKNNSNNNKEYRTRLKNLTDSKFLTNSRNQLNDCLKRLVNEDKQQEFICLIADKQIPSLNSLERFCKHYRTSESSDKKLMEYLRSLPNSISFKDLVVELGFLEKEIASKHLPLELNADNIASINIIDFSCDRTLSNKEINALLEKMYNVNVGENFLVKLPEHSAKETQTAEAFNIASEITYKLQSNPNTYHNLINLLKISKKDLELPDDVSTYIYTQAIVEKLPTEFIDFVNSSEWFNYNQAPENEIPNMVLHARLRAIDRFGLDGATDIKELYKPETKAKLQELFKTVYSTRPHSIKAENNGDKIIVQQYHGQETLKSIFTRNGLLISIMSKNNTN